LKFIILTFNVNNLCDAGAGRKPSTSKGVDELLTAVAKHRSRHANGAGAQRHSAALASEVEHLAQLTIRQAILAQREQVLTE